MQIDADALDTYFRACVNRGVHWNHCKMCNYRLLSEMYYMFFRNIPSIQFHHHHTARRCAAAILPFITVMMNASLQTGHTPVTQWHAIVTPELKNYRLVSNLIFVLKIVKRIALKQLVDFIQSNNLVPRIGDTATRRHHSTETALLRVISDFYATADGQQVTLLGLLDLSTAFNCVDRVRWLFT